MTSISARLGFKEQWKGTTCELHLQPLVKRWLANSHVVLWLTLPWAIFLIWKIPSININDRYCNPESNPIFQAGPGECYWYMHPSFTRYNAGIFIHLGSVIPAGLLAVLQFIPSIRQKYRTFHKYAGYVSTAFALAGNVGALMIMDIAFGGTLAIQTLVICLAPMTTFALCKGVIDARHKRFKSHREWMLRAWSYLGAILTTRVLMVSFLFFVTVPYFPEPQMWAAVPCGQILHTLQNDSATAYMKWPACDPSSPLFSVDGMAIVKATTRNDDMVETAAVFHNMFGALTWTALMIHTLAIEYYLNRPTKPERKSKSEDTRTSAAEKRE